VHKIPTLFVRNAEDRRFVTDQVSPGCEWVLAGEGVATRKYDGTCFMRDDAGTWWARREVRKDAVEPPGWTEIEEDPTTGKRVGWEPASNSSFVHFFDQAVARLVDPTPGTYELIGPRINRNPERADSHILVKHDDAEILDAPRTYEALAQWLRTRPYEGIVWHHDDGSGRMVKIKRRDFPAVIPARG
jgi:hypothetical protein